MHWVAQKHSCWARAPYNSHQNFPRPTADSSITTSIKRGSGPHTVAQTSQVAHSRHQIASVRWFGSHHLATNHSIRRKCTWQRKAGAGAGAGAAQALANGSRQPNGGPQPTLTPMPPNSEKAKPPWQQSVLDSILGVSTVPFSAYVALPVTFLHRIDARIKQVWLIALVLLVARASPPMRFGIAVVIAAITMLNFPRRLWQGQLQRLVLLCGVIFFFTALGSDGVPPVLQPRGVPPALEGLPPCPPTEDGYQYVLLHVWFITVTRKSVNLAITASTLTFTALQSASLCLVSTPGEEMAMALAWFLRPFRFLGVPAKEVALTLLLSLRFMSLVFEEVRNLCLGLAARGVNWAAQGTGGSIELLGRLCMRLFTNLFNRSESIAQAMTVRGFVGPERHNFYMMKVNPMSWMADLAALAALAALMAAVHYVR